MCSVEGQPSSGGPSALGGLRRPHGISRQWLRRWEFPPSAEAAGLLPAAAPTQRKDQRGRPGEGEMLPPVRARHNFTIWLVSCWRGVSVHVFWFYFLAPRGVQPPVCSATGICGGSGRVFVTLQSAGEPRNLCVKEGQRGSTQQGTNSTSLMLMFWSVSNGCLASTPRSLYTKI